MEVGPVAPSKLYEDISLASSFGNSGSSKTKLKRKRREKAGDGTKKQERGSSGAGLDVMSRGRSGKTRYRNVDSGEEVT